jgi:hypothetical protein
VNIDTAEAVTGEVVLATPAASAALEEYRPRIVMAPADAKALADQLQECMRAILKEGVDYGPIPGGDPDKKNLYKPGAEKLLQWFGFGSETHQEGIERDDPDYPSGIADKARRIGVTYRTEVSKTIPGGAKVLVATCEGYAGYDEDRYYTTAEDARAKAEAKERFWAGKDGRPPKPEKWQNATEYRAPWNTLIKMSQKRSYVGAAIDATGAAGLFTQDMEDVAGVTAVPAVMSAAGRAAIGKLPKAVARELDAWYKALNWPDPDAWDAEQWCTALVKAGKLSAESAPPKTPVPASAHEALREPPPAAAQKPARERRPPAAAQEPPAERPLPPSVDRDAQALADEAAKVTTADEMTALWGRASDKLLAGTIREPGGTYLGTLRAYFTYCENTLQESSGSAA